MGNTITQPITYGPHVMRNPRAEQAIRFLEDESNHDKPIPDGLLREDEVTWLGQHGRLACAQYIREGLQDGTIG